MGELDEGNQRVQTSSYKIKSTKAVMYHRININNTAVLYMTVVKRVIPRIHITRKHFFLFTLYLYEKMILSKLIAVIIA